MHHSKAFANLFFESSSWNAVRVESVFAEKFLKLKNEYLNHKIHILVSLSLIMFDNMYPYRILFNVCPFLVHKYWYLA